MLVILVCLLASNGLILVTAADDELLSVNGLIKDINNNGDTLTCDEDNEIVDDCPSNCPSDYCPTGVGQNRKCPEPNPCPPPACKCRFNTRRDQNGKCIPTRDCPEFECNKPNEEYHACPPLCPTDSCSQATAQCPGFGRIALVLECAPTCTCIRGYGRLENGTCVPYNQCPEN